MKKIIAILALMMMAVLLASCGGNKEGSKAEEGSEWAKVESAEKAAPIKQSPVKKANVDKTVVKKDNNLNNMTWSVNMSWSTTWTGKTEDQVVKDFEKELDWLFKLLETNAK